MALDNRDNKYIQTLKLAFSVLQILDDRLGRFNYLFAAEQNPVDTFLKDLFKDYSELLAPYKHVTKYYTYKDPIVEYQPKMEYDDDNEKVLEPYRLAVKVSLIYVEVYLQNIKIYINYKTQRSLKSFCFVSS